MNKQFKKAMTLFQKQQYEDAIAVFEELQQKFPEDANIINNLGVAYFHHQQIDKAVDCYKMALTIDPSLKDVYINLGFALYSLNDPEAIPFLEMAKHAFPENPEVLNTLAKALYKDTQIHKAIEEYENAKQLSPQDADLKANLAKAYLDLDRLDDALHEINEAITLHPNNFRLYYLLGEIYLLEERIDDAIEAFKTCLLKNPNFFEGYKKLAILYYSQNRYTEALGMTDFCKDIKPDTEVDKLHQLITKGINT